MGVGPEILFGSFTEGELPDAKVPEAKMPDAKVPKATVTNTMTVCSKVDNNGDDALRPIETVNAITKLLSTSTTERNSFDTYLLKQFNVDETGNIDISGSKK